MGGGSRYTVSSCHVYSCFKQKLSLPKYKVHFRDSAGGVFMRIQPAAVPETLPRILSECETSERNTSGGETEWTAAEQEV